ncbi:hypothetical protein L1987_61379 [Smallanthus sonchifolius]|uniref:Uncharacterized protein n=1 Tax=Smallanthus sonchifolius TaxID=185202 RepID=A0ACB9C7H8_9ASTR|nr:hypothetical protein L1987_61379 [Smallanthus sonchifolius]
MHPLDLNPLLDEVSSLTAGNRQGGVADCGNSPKNLSNGHLPFGIKPSPEKHTQEDNEEEEIVNPASVGKAGTATLESVQVGTTKVPANGNDDFTLVTRKRRRLKIKVQGKQRFHNRQPSTANRTGHKPDSNAQGTPTKTSSDPVIQRKMSDLHNNFVSSQKPTRRALSDVTNNRNLNPAKGNRNQNSPSQSHLPPWPNVPQSVIPKSAQANPSSSSGKPTRNRHNPQKPTATKASPQVNNSVNMFAALDSDMCELVDDPLGNQIGVDGNDPNKFYEFSVDSIAKVLKFNPSSLSIPRVNDMDLDLGEFSVHETPSDDEIPDFDITNAQKKAISSSLEKFGAVKVVDQANWVQGGMGVL